jgi:NAD(P)H-flavin reductase
MTMNTRSETSRLYKPDPMIPARYRVEHYHRDTYDTFTLGLAPLDEPWKPFAYSPGQFNMLYAFGLGEVPISISGDPEGKGILTHTTRSVGAITRALSGLRPGDIMGVRGPFGTSWPMEKAKGRDLVLVAGGIGLAPLRPALLSVIAERSSYRRVSLVYGARTPRDLLYGTWLKKWTRTCDIEVCITVDSSPKTWNGNVGVVTRLIPGLAFDPGHSIAMICGPEIMMLFTVSALTQKGMPEKEIYLSMERNMKCAIGFCGHCQFGPHFICKDGPVYAYSRLANLLKLREI